MLTTALLLAAERLGITGKELAAMLGVPPPTVTRMRKQQYLLEPGTKPYELGALFVRLFRSLDAITGGDAAVCSACCATKTRHSAGSRWSASRPLRGSPTVLPAWTHDALRSEQRPHAGVYWRCVEAQQLVSTLALVETLDDQAFLGDILEETKPPVPPPCEGLHYLYMTPFRYGLYPNGSRFRRAGRTPGVYYVSAVADTAVIETAFHLLLFYAESPATPFPTNPTGHTVFDVPVNTMAAIDLTRSPFDAAQALWTHSSDYGACQALEQLAREWDVGLIVYRSVRDPAGRCNAALLTCAAFAAAAPRARESWRIAINRSGVHAVGRGGIPACPFPPSASPADRDWQTSPGRGKVSVHVRPSRASFRGMRVGSALPAGLWPSVAVSERVRHRPGAGP